MQKSDKIPQHTSWAKIKGCRSLCYIGKRTYVSLLIINYCCIYIFSTIASFRDIAKEYGVLTNIVPLLNSGLADVRLQAMRAVGNLCIDHGKIPWCQRRFDLVDLYSLGRNELLPNCILEWSHDVTMWQIRTVYCMARTRSRSKARGDQVRFQLTWQRDHSRMQFGNNSFATWRVKVN